MTAARKMFTSAISKKIEPAEPHELVVAETRQGPAHPDEDRRAAAATLAKKDGDIDEAADNALPAVVRTVDEPPSESRRAITECGKCQPPRKSVTMMARAGDHRGVFAEEEERELHRANIRCGSRRRVPFPTSGRSKGRRFVSANIEMVKMTKEMNIGIGEEPFAEAESSRR